MSFVVPGVCHALSVPIFQSFRAGVEAALSANRVSPPPARDQLTAAALLAPSPTLELASPWADAGALSTIVLSELYGGDNLPPSRADAMAVPAIARARNIVCSTLARLGLDPVDVAGAPVDPASEHARFLSSPAVSSRWLLLMWTIDDLIFYGVSWWHVTRRYSSGRVASVRRVIPGGVELDERNGQTIVRVYGVVVTPGDVVRIDGPHEGILNYAAPTIRQARQLEKSAARYATNPIPAIDLHQTGGTPLTKPERTELIAEWSRARTLDTGGVAYTSPLVEARVLGTPPEMLLNRARNAAAIDAARIVGTPADSIDASLEHASMTYATVESRMRVLVDFGLAAYGSAIEARLSLDDVLPHGIRAAFDYAGITAASDADPSTSAPELAPPAPAVSIAPKGPNA